MVHCASIHSCNRPDSDLQVYVKHVLPYWQRTFQQGCPVLWVPESDLSWWRSAWATLSACHRLWAQALVDGTHKQKNSCRMIVYVESERQGRLESTLVQKMRKFGFERPINTTKILNNSPLSCSIEIPLDDGEAFRLCDSMLHARKFPPHPSIYVCMCHGSQLSAGAWFL